MKLVDPWKMEENVEKVYEAYERIVPAVWALLADGEWWEEAAEPYHERCRDCAKRAFRTLSKTDCRMLEYLASGIVMWSNFFPPERHVVVFRLKWDNVWKTYTALVSHEGRRRIKEKAHAEILLERPVDMSTNVDMTIRYLAQIVLDTVYELKEPEGAPAVRLNVRRAEPPKVVVDDFMGDLLLRRDDGEEDEVWVTCDGREIPVSEMSDEHIRNAIKLLKKAVEKIENTMPLTDAMERDMDADQARLEGWIETFERELERRALDREEG